MPDVKLFRWVDGSECVQVRQGEAEVLVHDVGPGPDAELARAIVEQAKERETINSFLDEPKRVHVERLVY